MDDYHKHYAARFKDTAFVSSSEPLEPGTEVTFCIVFSTGQRGLQGSAVVAERTVSANRPGVILKMLQLEPVKQEDMPIDDKAASQGGRDKEKDAQRSIAFPLPPPLPLPSGKRKKRPAPDVEETVTISGLTVPETPTRRAGRVLATGTEQGGGPQAPATDGEPPQSLAAKSAGQGREMPAVAAAATGSGGDVAHARSRASFVSRHRTAVIAALFAVAMTMWVGVYVVWSGVLQPERAATAEASAALATRGSEADRLTKRADEAIAAGRLVGPGGTFALDYLLAARREDPTHAGAKHRLDALAAKFAELGAVAESAGNLAEAAAHWQAALLADPSRDDLRAKMRATEESMRARSRAARK